MKILKALIISTLVSIAAFVVSGVTLAIFNIYLSGHGIDWPNQDLGNGMSPLSYLLGVLVMSVFLIVFILVVSLSKKQASANPEQDESKPTES